MIQIDEEKGIIKLEEEGNKVAYGIGTSEAFSLLSSLWLRSGWDVKYVYSFTWMGRPIIQLPEDMFRIQEIIFSLKPDVIIETGVAHGGSLIFYASLCKAIEHGRVIGIDIDIRPHNRKAIEEHILFPYITLIEGNSFDQDLVTKVKSLINEGEIVMVLLDSCHTKAHVMSELEAYAPLVTKGSYIVAMDGIMEQVVGAPRTQEDWSWNNPKQAAIEFVIKNKNFIISEPEFKFNEGSVKERVTYWPSGFLKRVK
jgi:cephalosporin hydroxylase